MILQSSAVPVLIQNNEPLFLVVNNLNHSRWLVPKGIIEDNLTPEETASKEAMEEAGVAGRLLEESLGTYTYNKWNDTLKVDLFVMMVENIYEHWDEDYFRKRRWVDWNQFLELVDERIPRPLLAKIPEMIGFAHDAGR